MKRSWVLVLLAAGCGSVSSKPDASTHSDGPSVDSAGQVDSPTQFSPSQLPGLVLWLDASQAVTTSQSKVSAWTDQSASNNSATQPTTAQQPTLVTGVINGHPVVRFDGASTALQIADAASLQWGTGDYVVEIVGSWKNGATSLGMLYAKAAYTTPPYPGALVWANMQGTSDSTALGAANESTSGYYVTGATMNLNDGTPRLYAARRYGGTNLEVRVNGVSDQSVVLPAATDVSATGNPAYIGGHPQNTTSVIQPLDGDIAEVVAVHGSLTTAQLSALETYLKTKYGL
jgi:hypothetical protein